MKIVILGGPGAGKGTIANILCENSKIPHISTGNLLRDESKHNAKIFEIMKEGQLIPDDITIDLLKARIQLPDCKNGFLLDGYPRNHAQACILNLILRQQTEKINYAIQLNVSDKVIIQRISGRKTCPTCQKSFGHNSPSKNGDYCDNCGCKLTTRADDNEETVQKRINLYKRESKDIFELYSEMGILIPIDGTGTPKQVLAEINKRIQL